MASSTSFFKNSGTSATLQTSFTVSVEQAQAAQVSSEAARDASIVAKDASIAAKNLSVTAKDNAETAETNAETAETAAGLSRADVVKLATNAHNSQYTLSDSSTGYSALHYNTESSSSATAAAGSAIATAADAVLTAADVVTTNADAASTYSDRGVVASDKAIVASDKAIVAADKAIVAADKGIVAADKALVNADKLAADSSATATGQDAIQTASDRVVVAADKALVAADKAIVIADKAIVASDKAIVASDKAIVAADKALVNADKLAADASATSAASSAASAANPWSIVSGTNNIEYDAGDVIIQSPYSGFRSLDFKSIKSNGSSQDDAQIVSNPNNRGVVIEAGSLSASNRGAITSGGVLALRDDSSVETVLSFHSENGTRSGMIVATPSGELSLSGRIPNGTVGTLNVKNNDYIRYPTNHVINQEVFQDSANYTSSTANLTLPAAAAGSGGNAWYAFKLSDHDAADRKTSDYKLNIALHVSGRFLENSDDPGFRAYLQYFRADTAIWTTIGSNDSYVRARYADRGTANYIYGTLATVQTINVPPAQARFQPSSGTAFQDHIVFRVLVQGVGGSTSDDLDVYWYTITVTECAYFA